MFEVDLSQAYTLEGALMVSCAFAFSYQLGRLFFRAKSDPVNQYQPFDNNQDALESEDKGVPPSSNEGSFEQLDTQLDDRHNAPANVPQEFNKAAANEEVIEPIADESPQAETVKPAPAKTDIDEKPIVLFVKPKGGETFSGYNLLKALADNDVHFSEQKHFQRFAEASGQGEVWFYVASLEQPGTFDMEEPGQVRCPGLVLILDCAKVNQLMHAYDALIESAHQLAKDLEAEVFDDTMQPLARPKINQWRHTCARRAACVYS